MEMPEPVGHLSRGATDGVWCFPKREKQAAVNKAGREEPKGSPLTSDMKLEDLEFALLIFSLDLVQCFLTMLPSSLLS